MAEKEWELSDLLRLLIKRRGFILFGTILSFLTLSALIYVTREPVTYGADCALKIGRVDDKSLDSASSISRYVKTHSIYEEVARGLNISLPEFEKAGIEVSSTDDTDPFVIITAEAPKPELAISTAKSAADALVAMHDVLFDQQFKPLLDYENKITRQVQEIEKDKKDLEDLAMKTNPKSDSSALALLIIQGQLQEMQTHLLSLHEKLRDIKIENYAEIHTRRTKIIGAAGPARKLAPSGLLRYLLLAALASPLLFAFLAILLEGWQKARTESAAQV